MDVPPTLPWLSALEGVGLADAVVAIRLLSLSSDPPGDAYGDGGRHPPLGGLEGDWPLHDDAEVSDSPIHVLEVISGWG